MSIKPNLYKRVVEKQGSKCYWCWSEVVRISDIPEIDRIKIKEFTLVYLVLKTTLEIKNLRKAKTYKLLVESPIATVDHRIRLIDSGTNDLDNLVVSCLACNNQREREEVLIEPKTNWFFGSKSIQHGHWQQCPHCQNRRIKFSFSFLNNLKNNLKKWLYR